MNIGERRVRLIAAGAVLAAAAVGGATYFTSESSHQQSKPTPSLNSTEFIKKYFDLRNDEGHIESTAFSAARTILEENSLDAYIQNLSPDRRAKLSTNNPEAIKNLEQLRAKIREYSHCKSNLFSSMISVIGNGDFREVTYTFDKNKVNEHPCVGERVVGGQVYLTDLHPSITIILEFDEAAYRYWVADFK